MHAFCPSCNKPVTSAERCIFCGSSLRFSLAPARWKTVYHAYNSTDAQLARATLASHGLTVRIRDENGSVGMVLGHGATVIEALEDETHRARQVLREVRGIRTDTEYLEWQALKNEGRSRFWLRLVAAGLVASVTALLAHSLVNMVLDYTRTIKRDVQAPQAP